MTDQVTLDRGPQSHRIEQIEFYLAGEWNLAKPFFITQLPIIPRVGDTVWLTIDREPRGEAYIVETVAFGFGRAGEANVMVGFDLQRPIAQRDWERICVIIKKA